MMSFGTGVLRKECNVIVSMDKLKILHHENNR